MSAKRATVIDCWLGRHSWQDRFCVHCGLRQKWGQR